VKRTLLALLVTVAVAAPWSPALALAVKSGADCPANTVQLLHLGAYHMDNPGLDAINTSADDVLAPRRQNEIAQAVDRLGVFQPTKIMIEARKQGFTGQFLGGNGFNTAVVSKQAGAAGKGAQSGSGWYINNTFPSNAAFVKAYRDKYGSDPDQFAAQGYAGILILADSAKRANLTFSDTAGDRTRLRDAMEKVNIDTPLGRFQFTSTHDVKQTIWVIQMDGAGGFNLVISVSPS